MWEDENKMYVLYLLPLYVLHQCDGSLTLTHLFVVCWVIRSRIISVRLTLLVVLWMTLLTSSSQYWRSIFNQFFLHVLSERLDDGFGSSMGSQPIHLSGISTEIIFVSISLFPQFFSHCHIIRCAVCVK